MVFLNFTNHPAEQWSSEQRAAAQQYGPIEDLPFPAVPPEYMRQDVESLAEQYVKKILKKDPAAVLCQGEMTLTFAVVMRLKAEGVPVLAACSERRTSERLNDNGETIRESHFAFLGFREY